MNIETRDPASLEIHPVLRAIPAPHKDSDEVKAAADAIRVSGMHVLPIVVDDSTPPRIITDDSRLRWMAARRMGMREVPVTIQPAAMAPVIAYTALIHRGHYTKSALAYLAYPMLASLFEVARAVRIENIKKSPISSIVSSGDDRGKTVEELAENLGMKRNLLFEAKRVHTEFAKDRNLYEFKIDGGGQDGAVVEQTLKDHFEPLILRQQVDSEQIQNRPIGLGGVLKAIGSVRAYDKAGGVRPPTDQLDLFESGLKRFRYWNDLTDEHKKLARQKLSEMVNEASTDLLDELLTLIKARRKSVA